MRMCVGYQDPNLILEAKFLMQHKAVLPNEIKKFFNYIMVEGQNEQFKSKSGFEGDHASQFVSLFGLRSCRHL